MPYSLRLPPALEADVRARADRLGISVNALICVAVDHYLRVGQDEKNAPEGVDVSVKDSPAKPAPEASVGPTAAPRPSELIPHGPLLEKLLKKQADGYPLSNKEQLRLTQLTRQARKAQASI